MEKLRSRPAYSIVAALRSTALRRVAKHVLAHRCAFDRPRPSFPEPKNPENQRLHISRSQTSQMGDLTSCSTGSTGQGSPGASGWPGPVTVRGPVALLYGRSGQSWPMCVCGALVAPEGPALGGTWLAGCRAPIAFTAAKGRHSTPAAPRRPCTKPASLFRLVSGPGRFWEQLSMIISTRGATQA